MNIKQALKKLDHGNDGHWTNDGLPRIDIMAEFMKKDVTREQITKANPEFIRVKPVTPVVPDPVAVDNQPETPVAAVKTKNSVEMVQEKVLSIKKTVRDLEAKIKERNQRLVTAKKEITELNLELVTAQKALIEAVPKSTTNSISTYLARQKNQVVQESKERKAALKALGIEAKVYASPMDQAFAHRPQRSGKRPTRI